MSVGRISESWGPEARKAALEARRVHGHLPLAASSRRIGYDPPTRTYSPGDVVVHQGGWKGVVTSSKTARPTMGGGLSMVGNQLIGVRAETADRGMSQPYGEQEWNATQFGHPDEYNAYVQRLRASVANHPYIKPSAYHYVDGEGMPVPESELPGHLR